MAGFFLTSDDRSLELATRHFEVLGHQQSKAKFGSFEATLAKKKLVPDAENLLELADGRIAGAGTWFTEDAFGHSALKAIAENIRSTGSLGDLSGHYSFVSELNGEAYLHADKSGTLPVYVAKSGVNAEYATSFLALVTAAPKLTLSTQEVLEFVNVEATLGNKTVFEEIEVMPFGSRVRLSPGNQPFEPVEDFVEQASPGSIVETLRAHMQRLRAFEARYRNGIGCELSGGLDSRTVAALLNFSAVPHVLNTNVNRADSADHETALRAAMAVGRPIELYSYPEDQADKEDIGRVFTEFDMARDVFRSKRSLYYFNAKSTLHPLLLGGYGGELVRSIYSTDGSVATVVARRYCNNLALPDRDRVKYQKRVEQKFLNTLEYVRGNSEERAAEKIYFFEKMRAWGGTRISTHNRFAYNYHPLFDLRVQKHLFSHPIKDKEASALQLRLIALDPALAAQPYLSKDKSQDLRQRLGKTKIAKRLVRAVRSSVQSLPPLLAETRALSEPMRSFAAGTGVPYELCRNESAQGRYLTLVRLYELYQDKIAFRGVTS